MTAKRPTVPRSPVALEVARGRLRMVTEQGAVERPVADANDPEQVYAAYLSVLYAVRGARRGQELPLRSSDLDALLAVVGEDPEQIERRLVELMGCTPEEASLLRRTLLRHRALAASVGVAAGLSLVALVGPTSAAATPASEPVPAASVSASASSTPTTTPTTTPAAPPSAAPAAIATEAAAPEAATPATPATSAATATAVPASAAPAAVPTAKATPSPSVTSSATASSEVVLGEPRAPIDRPGWSPEPEQTSEVVLGEPRPPIDRPGWSPDQEEPAAAEPAADTTTTAEPDAPEAYEPTSEALRKSFPGRPGPDDEPVAEPAPGS